MYNNDDNSLISSDARAAESYNFSHIITARNAKWVCFSFIYLFCYIVEYKSTTGLFFACFSKDSEGKFIMPLDVEVESMRYIIVYDSSTHSLSDSGKTLPFLTCCEHLCKYPIQRWKVTNYIYSRYCN